MTEENLLKALVAQQRWTYERFRTQFELAAQELAEDERDPRVTNLTVAERTYRNWMSGQVKTLPQPDQCRVLERLFGRPVEELFANASNASALAEPRESGLVLPSQSLEVARAEPGQDLKGQLEMAARRAQRFGEFAEASGVGSNTIENIQFELQRLATDYTQKPLALILNDLIDVQNETFQYLEQRQRPEQARELYLLAAIGTGMLAKASHDLNDPRSAMTHARTAVICAENAAHDGMQGWIRGLQSMVAYWAGQHQTAIKYARAGQPFANRTAGTARIWLSSLEARACAALGDVEGTQAAILKAESAWDQTLPDDLDQYGGILTFTRPRQLYYAADALVWLPNDAVDSESAAEIALVAYDDAPARLRSFSDEAGTRTDLALGRLANGELEGAVDAIGPVFDLPAERRINGIRTSMMHVHEALRGSAFRQVSGAADIREQIENFCQTPAVAALPR